MRIMLSAAAVMLAASFAAAPTTAPAQQSRIRQLVIYGNDPCPQGTGGEIIVCARRPEIERNRIPPNLREDGDNSPERQSWATRAKRIEQVGDTGTDSCSTVGAGGQTGCLQKMIDAAEGDEAANAPNNQPQ